ncbi:MAG: tetratricopeptide repeat protein [Planctomycetota bacterium]|jgi:tetratricopeptide (TPR) repeat protein|nr:tetratricopeptide repeat protein [Planctomycetota bacterium]
MVDLSKHLARAKQAVERRNYDLAIEITTECQEVDAANVDNYRMLLDASKRRTAEGGKAGFSMRLSLSKDPHKQLSGCIKAVAKKPDIGNLEACGDAAKKVYDSGVKSMLDVVIMFYEEARGTGLLSKSLLWSLGHAYLEKFKATKDPEPLDKAINAVAELHRADKSHGEAARTLKNWEAMKSMARRNEGGDYTKQLADKGGANKNEVMNRMIRTKEDAEEVLSFIDKDLAEDPTDKSLLMKKGDVHRRIGQFKDAKGAYDRAAEVDPHDFVITMRQGDVVISAKQAQIKVLESKGQDVSAIKEELGKFEVAQYRLRVQRQPTEMSHRFNLGSRLFEQGDVDGAAAEFQQSVKDPRYRKQSHNYLGHAFSKKNLLDLARKQFTECLSLIADDLSTEYKEVLYNRARVSEAMGDNEAAVADFTKVVELDLAYKDSADRLNQLRS